MLGVHLSSLGDGIFFRECRALLFFFERTLFLGAMATEKFFCKVPCGVAIVARFPFSSVPLAKRGQKRSPPLSSRARKKRLASLLFFTVAFNQTLSGRSIHPSLQGKKMNRQAMLLAVL